MAIQKRLYTVDDVWELQRKPGNQDKHYELIDGELIEMSPANHLHSTLTLRLGYFLQAYILETDAGTAGVEGGFYPQDDRMTLLAPDLAFIGKARQPDPDTETYIGFMPDLAVEIMSPSNTLTELREKAAIYLSNGTRLVWIVIPAQKRVEVCRLDDEEQLKIESVGKDEKLRGEDVLPGFELELRQLFSA